MYKVVSRTGGLYVQEHGIYSDRHESYFVAERLRKERLREYGDLTNYQVKIIKI